MNNASLWRNIYSLASCFFFIYGEEQASLQETQGLMNQKYLWEWSQNKHFLEIATTVYLYISGEVCVDGISYAGMFTSFIKYSF